MSEIVLQLCAAVALVSALLNLLVAFNIGKRTTITAGNYLLGLLFAACGTVLAGHALGWW